jgi:hypothetical protein
MQAFVTAYDAKRPMSVQEKAQLPQFIQYAALTIAFWRFRCDSHTHATRTQHNTTNDTHSRFVVLVVQAIQCAHAGRTAEGSSPGDGAADCAHHSHLPRCASSPPSPDPPLLMWRAHIMK